jgi:hypothetical protein
MGHFNELGHFHCLCILIFLIMFFHRGFKTVGPFVVMIYRMIMGDLLRFVSIYLVFVMGFSQCKYKYENKMKYI